jgi:hypothetical protein
MAGTIKEDEEDYMIQVDRSYSHGMLCLFVHGKLKKLGVPGDGMINHRVQSFRRK